MGFIHPNNDLMRGLLKTVPLGQPLVMINQLKFRVTALYPVGSSEAVISGREAYKLYTDLAGPCVAEVGGELVWRGDGLGVMIGPEGELWHAILLVKYPSISAFLQMLSLADYQKATVHRTAALEDSRLIITKAVEG